MARWSYKVCDVQIEGTFETYTDFGGTDVTYWFRRDDGTLDLVSGQPLKDARVITK